MKKLNVKGFTLIELLAIISILAIILLIAVPAIANVIENANRGAFKNSALSIVDAAEDAVALQSIETDAGEYDSTNKTVLNGTTTSYTVIDVQDLTFKNNTGWEGRIIIDNNSKKSYVFVTDTKRSFVEFESEELVKVDNIKPYDKAAFDAIIAKIDAVTSDDVDTKFQVSENKLTVQ